jgi:deazaflavin-dependent oxidoreductase (nitroreductase family)
MDTITDTRLRTMNIVHRTMLTLSGGRLGATIGNMPVYKVTTTGRVSGQPRTVMLTVPVKRDDTYVLVASKGGDDRDPDWYRNMVANPQITIEPVDGGGPITLVARTASTEEKDELWPQIVSAYRGYGGYQSKTERDIPVVIAEPAPA